jgi:hypothetical protein
VGTNTLGISVFASRQLIQDGETIFVISGFPYLSSFPPFEGRLATVMLPASLVFYAKERCSLLLLAPGDMLKLEVAGDMDASGFLEVTGVRSIEVKPAPIA